MEANLRWVPVTAVAPVAWGSTYFVTHRYLPADYPLYGAAIRALPAGLLLLLVHRRRPHGSWWWRSLVLGTLNMGAFFALVYLAAQKLPASVASTVMATSPAVIMLFAWAALASRPRAAQVVGAAVGVGGAGLMLLNGAGTVTASGVLASVGYVLTKRWGGDVDVFSLTSWQLIAGGLVLAPLALAVEGRPPTLNAPALLAFGYVTVVATALAFAAWFTGLRHLDAATVGIVGLLNPVTGVLLGTAVAGEALTARQICGLVLVVLGIAASVRAPRPLRPPRQVTMEASGWLGPRDRVGSGGRCSSPLLPRYACSSRRPRSTSPRRMCAIRFRTSSPSPRHWWPR
jgi:probable blue pigment (indigoidine) exporter